MENPGNSAPEIRIDAPAGIKSTWLAARVALMSTLAFGTISWNSESSTPLQNMEQTSNLETHKDVSIVTIWPSRIDWQKRYQEISINDAKGDLPTGIIEVQMMVALPIQGNFIWNLIYNKNTRQYTFDPKKRGQPVYLDAPSDGNGEQ
jgi:hypothetical protein